MIKPCLICGELPKHHPLLRDSHKTCGKKECKQAYRRLHDADRDNQRRTKQRLTDESNGIEMISCAICGGRFEVIQSSHLRKHDVTIKRYREQFPDAPLVSKRMRLERSKGAISQSKYLDYEGKAVDQRLFEFLTGTLLGDGSLEKREGKLNARYKEGGNNFLYIKWKHNFLSEYFHCTFQERHSKPDSRTGNSYLGWWITTSVHPILTEWH